MFDLEEMLTTVELAGKSTALRINEDKTKYMEMEVGWADNIRLAIKIRNYNFENVTIFIYLRVRANSKGNMSFEMNNRVLKDDKTCFANIKLINRRFFNWNNQTKTM